MQKRHCTPFLNVFSTRLLGISSEKPDYISEMKRIIFQPINMIWEQVGEMDLKPLNLNHIPLTLSSPIIKQDVINSSVSIIPNAGFLLKSFSVIVFPFCIWVFLFMQYWKRYTEVPHFLCHFLFIRLNSDDTKNVYFSRVFCRAGPTQKQNQVHKQSICTASLRKWHAAHSLTRIFRDRKCLLSLRDAGVYATGKNGTKWPGKSFLVFLFKPVQRDRQCLANKCILNTHPGHVYTPFVNNIGNWE